MTDSREIIWFKKVPDGYVFRAPNPWVFGRGRYFLVDEAQKAQLLAIMTARSQFVTAMVFFLGLAVMFGASVAAIAFISGHDEPTVGDIVMMVVLVPLCMYAALLITSHPTARRVQPLLADLTPTDQRITAADRRLAAQKTISLPGQLMLAASQAILTAVFFIQAMQKTGGNLTSVFDNGSALSSAFAGCCFGFSSTFLLFAALQRFRHRQQETVPAERSPRKLLLPGFSLAISVAALGLVLYAGHIQSKMAERRQKSVEISHRLAAVKEHMEKSSFTARQVSMKTRIAANGARMNALIGKLNHPTVRCETVASTDDPGRLEDARLCAERARQERQAVQVDMATTRKEGDALRQENTALQQEVAAIRTELAAIQAENDANR